jgi:hypothetical protein
MTGTDLGTAYLLPGFSVHDELRWLVRAGLTPLQALRAATLEPAATSAATTRARSNAARSPTSSSSTPTRSATSPTPRGSTACSCMVT